MKARADIATSASRAAVVPKVALMAASGLPAKLAIALDKDWTASLVLAHTSASRTDGVPKVALIAGCVCIE